MTHNPQAEAQAILPDGYRAHVLEPSPPAVADGPWFADDPAMPDAAGETGGLAVTPTAAGDVSWEELARTRFADDAEALAFMADRWLANWKKLPELPADYQQQLVNAHRLAFGVVSEARRVAPGGKFGLRWVKGGFGTPYFGDNQQVRVAEGKIIWQQGGSATSQPITSLQAAADFLGVAPVETQREHDSPPLGDINEDLQVTAQTIHFLGEWFGCATAALETVRAEAADGRDSRVQLWPGHFDPATDLGQDAAKGTFGASPGDHAEHPHPYLYVSPWEPTRAEEDPAFWNANNFVGAVLKFEDIVASDEPSSYHAVRNFYLSAFARLQQGA